MSEDVDHRHIWPLQQLASRASETLYYARHRSRYSKEELNAMNVLLEIAIKEYLEYRKKNSND